MSVSFFYLIFKAASFAKGSDQVLLLDLDTQVHSILGFHAGIDALTFTASGDEMVLAQANGLLLVSDMFGFPPPATLCGVNLVFSFGELERFTLNMIKLYD